MNAKDKKFFTYFKKSKMNFVLEVALFLLKKGF